MNERANCEELHLADWCVVNVKDLSRRQEIYRRNVGKLSRSLFSLIVKGGGGGGEGREHRRA